MIGYIKCNNTFTLYLFILITWKISNNISCCFFLLLGLFVRNSNNNNKSNKSNKGIIYFIKCSVKKKLNGRKTEYKRESWRNFIIFGSLIIILCTIHHQRKIWIRKYCYKYSILEIKYVITWKKKRTEQHLLNAFYNRNKSNINLFSPFIQYIYNDIGSLN